MALQKQIVSIPVSSGLDTKTDSKQVMAGAALVLENARFQKTGKLSKRFGLVGMTDNIPSELSVKAVASDGKALNVITSGGVYSYSSSVNGFKNVSLMANTPKITSRFTGKTTLNQFNPDTDYSPSIKIILTVYREKEELDGLKPATLEFVTVCLEDEETGLKKTIRISVIGTNYKKMLQKILILDTPGDVRIIVFYQTATGYVKLVMNEELVILSTVVFAPGAYNQFTSKFDIVKDGSNIFLISMQGTSISSYKYDYAGFFILSTVVTTTNRLAIAVVSSEALGFSICADTSNIHIFFVSNTSGEIGDKIIGIGLNKSLAVSITESSKSLSSIRNLSICKSGSDVLVVVQKWETATIGPTTFTTSRVYTGVASIASSYTINVLFADELLDLGARLEISSRPFVVSGTNYIVCKCPERNQLSGFVYNLDQKKSSAIFSPFGLSESRSTRSSSFDIASACNSVVSNGKVYTSIEKVYNVDTDNPVAFDFIANVGVARIELDYNDSYLSGTKTKLGETIYYTNGPTMSIDSRGAYETSFELNPDFNYTLINTDVTNPDIASKVFSYIAIYAFYNGKGEIERSGLSRILTITTPANANYISLFIRTLPFSYKDSSNYTSDIILYRTTNGGSTFYRCSNAPNNSSNRSVTMFDAVSDANLSNNEQLYTTGNVLSSDSCPNAKFSTSGGNRIFVGGLEDQDEIAYSNKQLFSESVEFNDALRIRVSSGASADKTPVSAIGYMDGKVIIFRQQSIYFVQGDGPTRTGEGGFTEPEIISSDVGCPEPKSVVNVADGIMFKSKKGIYLLSRSLQVSYIGKEVEDFNESKVVSALISDKFNEARFYTDTGSCLVFNYLFGAWSVFTSQTTLDADVWAGSPISVKSNRIFKETENIFLDNNLPYSMRFTSPWLKVSEVQGFQRCYNLWIIGDFKSPHTLRCKVYVDYDDSVSNDYALVYNGADGNQYQFKISLPNQKIESIKFEIYDDLQTGTGESYGLSNLQAEIGIKSGGAKLAATKTY